MRVSSSQGEAAGGSRPEHRRLLETAKGWTEEARRGLEAGERLPPRQMTLFRYVCMAALTTTHRVPEETVARFRVSHSDVPSGRFLFPSDVVGSSCLYPGLR